MRYVLLTSGNEVMQFHIKEMADLYQTIYGGVIVTEQPVKTAENVEIQQ